MTYKKKTHYRLIGTGTLMGSGRSKCGRTVPEKQIVSPRQDVATCMDCLAIHQEQGKAMIKKSTDPMDRFHVELWFDSNASKEQVEFLYEEHEFEVLEETLALSGKTVGKNDRETLISVNEGSGNRAQALMQVLDRVFRFPHNVDKVELLEAVYGPIIGANSGYKDTKLDLLMSRGFPYWYCDLDLANQEKVANLMLERYKDLGDMLP